MAVKNNIYLPSKFESCIVATQMKMMLVFCCPAANNDNRIACTMNILHHTNVNKYHTANHKLVAKTKDVSILTFRLHGQQSEDI